MNTTARDGGLSHHPAPRRAQVRVVPLAFGLLAAPLGWAVLVYAGPALAGLAGGKPAIWLLYCVTMTLSLAGLVVAMRSYRRSADEQQGSPDEVMEIGTGRTRFLALWGIVVSAGFGIAVAVTAVGLALLPVDGH